MMKKLSPLVCVLVLWSCGAASDDSTVTTPTDTISSTASVEFNPATSTIEVLARGPDPKSDMFEACNFSMDPIKGNLSYKLDTAQDELTLGGGTFTFKRALKSPKTKAGVADRIFSVWAAPNKTTDGITLALELEVEPELLIFRMTCTG